ncbi:centromere/kinetochore protein zw10 homolog [Plodia interpunctella]|uniref:centromere/kinetochore protein zw10 homolog n=1 Tax=Plodia interpunctella TaxID=58824 RepID=UPI002368E912|nr:centromere/kinetochore protein zw10 homolog [Plodia interpunctella]
MADYNVENVLKTIFSDSSTWKPADKIPLVIKEIEQLKIDMKSFLHNSDSDITSIVDEGKKLCAESKALVDEMEQCKREIEQETMAEILKSIENHDKLSKELQRVNFALNIVFDVVQCGKYVKEFDEGRDAQSFTRSIEAVYDLVQHIEVPAEGFKQLDLYINTKTTGQLILDNLLHELYNEWNLLVYTNIKATTRKTVITIKLKLEDNNLTRDIINALDRCKRLNEKLSKFAQFLLKDVLIPIIHNDCTVFAETDVLMTVTVNHKQNNKPPYDAVIANLRLLFHYLSNRLNLECNRDCTIMQNVGKEICLAFKDILVQDCLIDTIPNNINELQSYGKITSEIEDFQHFLSVVKFFPENKLSILDYVKNIDVLFADKSSQYFLETARSIMVKDLSATMSIGVEIIPESNEAAASPLDENTEDALKILNDTLPKSLFYFPRCMISKTAQELLDLVYVMMEQAVQCSDVVCKKLYNTTRLVFELYDAVVPYHHENYLQTIPQYVALFHNNCMYLAHNLQTFGDKWLILMEGRELDYPISFVDLVQKLRDLGYQHLTVHMQQQRKQILDNVRSSDLNCIVVKDVLSDNAEAAVRQCLRQLHLLKNVWIGVFPANVFVRLMGTLVNMFVDELIHRVCSVEDISMDMATQLSDIYTLVVQKAPTLFQNPTDVESHVKPWVKLQELIFILNGSLKDIEHHWQDGAGPLAIHFHTEELRSLIKALFQNTQFRANLLSKIK